MKKNGPLVFVHIPKTAGTTLHKVLSHQFPRKKTLVTHESVPTQIKEEADQLKEGNPSRYDLVMGHLGIGIHEYIPSTRYIACVREPVSRLISHYSYAKETTNHYLYDVIHSQGMSLVDYVCSGLSGELSNGMTRTLAAVEDYDGTEVDDAVYEQALKNIEELFLFVGTTERFDEGLIVLQEKLGWTTPYYIRKKVGSYKGQKKELSEEEREAVLNVNQYDVKLYNYLNERLDAELSKLADAESRVARFKAANARSAKRFFYLRELRRRFS